MPTDLERVADDLVRRWQARLTGRGLLLVPESSGSAEVDPIRLAQIADALLDNAAKFALPGTVALRLVEAPGGGAALEVRDSGPGVPADQRERMFEPFVQLHGANDRVVGGAGIGLALVGGITRCMGGSVAATAAPEGGLAVAVHIPGGDGS